MLELHDVISGLASGEIRELGKVMPPGRRLRLWRQITGTDSYELCYDLQISHSTLMRYERAARAPDPQVIKRLQEEYGFSWG